MSTEANGGTQIRLVGAFAGIGSGVTKVAIGHGYALDMSQPPIRANVITASTLVPSASIESTILTDKINIVKTRIQCSAPGTYKHATDVLLKTIRNEGVLALYKGATPPAVGWAVIDSVLMGSLHNYRLFLIRHGMTERYKGVDRLSLPGHALSGFCAGLTSAFIATPMEMLKVRLQLQTQRSATDRQFKGPIDLIRKTISTQGVFGLWSGLSGSLLYRSNFLWMFLSFEVFMRAFSALHETPLEIGTGLANFFSGGLASFAFWCMAIPMDNIKNRMMAFPYPQPLAPPLPRRPSVAGTAREIYASVGMRGFYRGLGPSLLRAFPSNACAFFVYEGLMRTFGAEKTRQ